MSELKQLVADRLHEINLETKPNAKTLAYQHEFLKELTDEDIIDLGARKVFFNAAFKDQNDCMKRAAEHLSKYPKGGIV